MKKSASRSSDANLSSFRLSFLPSADELVSVSSQVMTMTGKLWISVGVWLSAAAIRMLWVGVGAWLSAAAIRVGVGAWLSAAAIRIGVGAWLSAVAINEVDDISNADGGRNSNSDSNSAESVGDWTTDKIIPLPTVIMPRVALREDLLNSIDKATLSLANLQYQNALLDDWSDSESDMDWDTDSDSDDDEDSINMPFSSMSPPSPLSPLSPFASTATSYSSSESSDESSADVAAHYNRLQDTITALRDEVERARCRDSFLARLGETVFTLPYVGTL
ncbi:uncharacterized protein F5147DRAFT_780348 [Suillus discolor]|uniref:Uncharacterized protein n=1 Tax=Suillus discolor TaxID=1912936 RepID=A0A9P7ETT8_9AGAM|nr:uncharacterized protein F5147DRAFT_780348 [Suillus discolor]KAG2090395.1 hypothetical protein F5147DRAFT_780348 [Suillus discolor]